MLARHQPLPSGLCSVPGYRPVPGGPRDVGEASVGELIGGVARDLSTLMRQELALARAELKERTQTALS